MTERQKTVESVKTEICENYCKYTSGNSELEEGKMYEKCENCPLDRL